MSRARLFRFEQMREFASGHCLGEAFHADAILHRAGFSAPFAFAVHVDFDCCCHRSLLVGNHGQFRQVNPPAGRVIRVGVDGQQSVAELALYLGLVLLDGH
jgi:hypothetical protein